MRRNLLNFYLLITAQSRRLVFEILKDGQLNFKELHPKWRDDEHIVNLAVRLDLSNMAWCGERFREDLAFVIEAPRHWQIEIKPTTIRDVYFAFHCVDAKTHSSKRFFWGTAIVKFFNWTEFEFAVERAMAESLFAVCTNDAKWFISNNSAASLEMLRNLFPSFTAETYARALVRTKELNLKSPPDWIW